MKIALYICSIANGMMAMYMGFQGKSIFEPLALSLLFSISAKLWD